MKKNKLILSVVLMVLTLGSCNKKENNTLINDTENIQIKNGKAKTIREQLLLLPQPEQRLRYMELSAEQKAQVWKDKMNYVLNSIKLSPNQSTAVQDILSELEERIFIFDSQEYISFISTHDERWNAEMKNLFGESLARDIFSEIDNIPSIAGGRNSSLGGGSEVCECSRQSDWCGFSSSCFKPEWCYEKPGCGTLWNYLCTGFCK